jgi:hypothetical protein
LAEFGMEISSDNQEFDSLMRAPRCAHLTKVRKPN